ncbi:MAG: carboxypeptidase-like regulatory domain-containing protein, partial [Mariniphaga sp.]
DDQGAIMAGAEVFLDGKSVATTDAAGKYTIPQMLPGDYVVLAKKPGYVANRFTLNIASTGGDAQVLSLKKLSTPVVVKPSVGATIVEKATTGETIASLVIPPSSFAGTADVQISVTTLAPAQAAPIPQSVNLPEASGEIEGVSISLDCSNPNITFPAGVTLVFNLPYTHEPGSSVLVITYNEGTGVWEEYQNAIVGPDGDTASLTIYHFSTWTAMVRGLGSYTITSVLPTEIPYPANGKYVYSPEISISNLPITMKIDFVVNTLESLYEFYYTSVRNGGGTASARKNSPTVRTIPVAPLNNPEGRGNVAKIDWQLLQYNYIIVYTLKVDNVYNKTTKTKGPVFVNGTVVFPTFAWGWRELPTFTWPADRLNGTPKILIRNEPAWNIYPKITLFMGHNGGLAG